MRVAGVADSSSSCVMEYIKGRETARGIEDDVPVGILMRGDAPNKIKPYEQTVVYV